MLMGISSSADGVGRPWKEGERRINRLIFIGRKLNKEELLRSFMACTVTGKLVEKRGKDAGAGAASAAAKAAAIAETQ